MNASKMYDDSLRTDWLKRII